MRREKLKGKDASLVFSLNAHTPVAEVIMYVLVLGTTVEMTEASINYKVHTTHVAARPTTCTVVSPEKHGFGPRNQLRHTSFLPSLAHCLQKTQIQISINSTFRVYSGTASLPLHQCAIAVQIPRLGRSSTTAGYRNHMQYTCACHYRSRSEVWDQGRRLGVPHEPIGGT